MGVPDGKPASPCHSGCDDGSSKYVQAPKAVLRQPSRGKTVRWPQLAPHCLMFIAQPGEGVVLRASQLRATFLCSTEGRQERAFLGNEGLKEGRGGLSPVSGH